jgi:ribosomal protein S18 acetylase RimI-like enzyme
MVVAFDLGKEINFTIVYITQIQAMEDDGPISIPTLVSKYDHGASNPREQDDIVRYLAKYVALTRRKGKLEYVGRTTPSERWKPITRTEARDLMSKWSWSVKKAGIIMNLFEAYRSNQNCMVFDVTVHDRTKPQVFQVDDEWVYNDAPYLPGIVIDTSIAADVQDIVRWIPFNKRIVRDGHQDGSLWVVRDDGKVAGFVVGLLDLLHVREEYRCCGIGGRLVEHIIQIAHDRKLGYIDIEATSNKSRKFFRSRGFNLVPRMTGQSEISGGHSWMRLILDGKNHDQDPPLLHARWSMDYDPATGRSRSREVRSEGQRLYGSKWLDKISFEDYDYMMSF